MDSERKPLIDSFGRTITYLRVSVTDRCDFRCVYCMAENMTFLPRKDLLTLEELERLCGAFVDRGVTKLRLTGGEPLVRKNLIWLIDRLGARIGDDLDELTLTTNASQLHKYADDLYAAGVRRINVSLDTLNPDKFREVTRWGDLEQVLRGIEAGKRAGLKIKINTVALKEVNGDELLPMIRWAHSEGHDITFIETMPLGDIDGDRTDQFLPLDGVRKRLEQELTLIDSTYQTGGPARYVTVRETDGRVGFITPLSHNFCASCNRVRLTCTGTLFMCLGQEDHVEFREALRAGAGANDLNQLLDLAMGQKPERHDFVIKKGQTKPAVSRHMSQTGG